MAYASMIAEELSKNPSKMESSSSYSDAQNENKLTAAITGTTATTTTTATSSSAASTAPTTASRTFPRRRRSLGNGNNNNNNSRSNNSSNIWTRNLCLATSLGPKMFQKVTYQESTTTTTTTTTTKKTSLLAEEEKNKTAIGILEAMEEDPSIVGCSIDSLSTSNQTTTTPAKNKKKKKKRREDGNESKRSASRSSYSSSSSTSASSSSSVLLHHHNPTYNNNNNNKQHNNSNTSKRRTLTSVESAVEKERQKNQNLISQFRLRLVQAKTRETALLHRIDELERQQLYPHLPMPTVIQQSYDDAPLSFMEQNYIPQQSEYSTENQTIQSRLYRENQALKEHNQSLQMALNQIYHDNQYQTNYQYRDEDLDPILAIPSIMMTQQSSFQQQHHLSLSTEEVLNTFQNPEKNQLTQPKENINQQSVPFQKQQQQEQRHNTKPLTSWLVQTTKHLEQTLLQKMTNVTKLMDDQMQQLFHELDHNQYHNGAADDDELTTTLSEQVEELKAQVHDIQSELQSKNSSSSTRSESILLLDNHVDGNVMTDNDDDDFDYHDSSHHDAVVVSEESTANKDVLLLETEFNTIQSQTDHINRLKQHIYSLETQRSDFQERIRELTEDNHAMHEMMNVLLLGGGIDGEERKKLKDDNVE